MGTELATSGRARAEERLYQQIIAKRRVENIMFGQWQTFSTAAAAKSENRHTNPFIAHNGLLSALTKAMVCHIGIDVLDVDSFTALAKTELA